jgi:hypothetical protein
LAKRTNHYFKPAKIASIREIRRRIIEKGESNSMIMEALGLATRTYFGFCELAFQGKKAEYEKLVLEDSLVERLISPLATSICHLQITECSNCFLSSLATV